VRDDQHWRGVELPPDYDPRPFIAAQEWRFAKTMPWHPHEYVMIHKATDAFEHVRFLVWIRLTGKIEVYKGSEYPHVEIDGYRYWALRPEYTIINRRTAPTPDDPHPPLPWQTEPIPEPPAKYPDQPTLM
jgi:hypothetical protein